MVDSVKIKSPPHDPIAAALSSGDDRLVLSHWLPPQTGIAPHIRVGNHWFNLLWMIPISAAGLVIIIAVAQSLRELPAIQAFIRAYPGIAQAAPSVESGFPRWLQVQHFLNMLFMMFIIRAGIQILADHPRLYWNRHCTPGTEWFRFQKPVPKDRMWTAKDDSVTLPSWLGIPGLRHTIGLARWWHFPVDLLWMLNGIAFYVLLFATDQWRRLVPLTWEVFPNALSTAIQYASLNFPVDQGWTLYNGLQQLSYFVTIFIAAPLSIATGLLQSPAISNRLGLLGTVLNCQVVRSIHFISFLWFAFFIVAHGIMVFVTGLRQNTNHMFAGVDSANWIGFPIFVLAMVLVAAAWWMASPVTIRHARLVQKTGRVIVGWFKGLSEWWEPTAQLTEKDISPYFWPNGTLPNSPDYEALLAGQFAGTGFALTG